MTALRVTASAPPAEPASNPIADPIAKPAAANVLNAPPMKNLLIGRFASASGLDAIRHQLARQAELTGIMDARMAFGAAGQAHSTKIGAPTHLPRKRGEVGGAQRQAASRPGIGFTATLSGKTRD